MRTIVLFSAVLLTSFAFAEEKTCTVKNMHCQDCADTVTNSLCKDKSIYSTCEVKIINKTKEVGQVHLITKDAAAKVDEKELGTIIDSSGYQLDKCHLGGPKKSGKG